MPFKSFTEESPPLVLRAAAVTLLGFSLEAPSRLFEPVRSIRRRHLRQPPWKLVFRAPSQLRAPPPRTCICANLLRTIRSTISSTHQQRDQRIPLFPAGHHSRSLHLAHSMAAPPSFSIFTATRNRSEPRTLHRNLHHATTPPRTPSSSSFTRATTDRASSAHHCTSHRPSSRLRTCNFEPSSGATRDHRSRTCNHRKHSRRRTTHHHLREPAPSRTPPAFRAAAAATNTMLDEPPPASLRESRSNTTTPEI
ncbi:putative uncharacterized protein ENSP00000383309 [Vigna unguiculata]|uniref:putative uncharacterized protein ENSP00000383309 n=1 Tax=Vigna unguiculata TaxID=3917 RepID=UPI001015CD57|nr:putative uncharacterized protein ENSP00000383309 [Vigna unguiculata]